MQTPRIDEVLTPLYSLLPRGGSGEVAAYFLEIGDLVESSDLIVFICLLCTHSDSLNLMHPQEMPCCMKDVRKTRSLFNSGHIDVIFTPGIDKVLGSRNELQYITKHTNLVQSSLAREVQVRVP